MTLLDPFFTIKLFSELSLFVPELSVIVPELSVIVSELRVIVPELSLIVSELPVFVCFQKIKCYNFYDFTKKNRNSIYPSKQATVKDSYNIFSI